MTGLEKVANSQTVTVSGQISAGLVIWLSVDLPGSQRSQVLRLLRRSDMLSSLQLKAGFCLSLVAQRWKASFGKSEVGREASKEPDVLVLM